MNKKFYETPLTQHVEVELEEGVMAHASVFHPEDGHDKGLTIEEHEFANPDKPWEGDYSNDNWD